MLEPVIRNYWITLITKIYSSAEILALVLSEQIVGNRRRAFYPAENRSAVPACIIVQEAVVRNCWRSIIVTENPAAAIFGPAVLEDIFRDDWRCIIAKDPSALTIVSFPTSPGGGRVGLSGAVLDGKAAQHRIAVF